MTKLDPDRSGGGNTLTPPIKVSKQAPLRISHFFTWNNYPENFLDLIDPVFRAFGKKWAFQEETGAQGTKHIQGVITCKKKCRDTEFKLPKGIHWEAMKGTWEEAVAYCQKDDTKTGGRWSHGLKRPIETITELRPWQETIIEVIKTKPDDRTIHWYWSAKGNIGKSVFTKYLVVHHDAIFCVAGIYSDICNLIFNNDMDERTIVIFDLPRNNGNHISYSALESIKNGLISNTKYETGFKAFNSPHVIVFSNEEPEHKKLSEDRWHIINLDSYICNEAECHTTDNKPSC